jgi:3-oxoisoapionate decarboxylase
LRFHSKKGYTRSAPGCRAEGMKVGIGSWTYGWSIGVRGYPAPAKPLIAIEPMSLAHDRGLGVVQLADNLPVHALSSSDLAELKVRASEWNIEIEIGAVGVEPNHLMRYLEIARYLDSKLVRSLVADVTLHGELSPF